MAAVAITVGILALLYILVVQWSYQRNMIPLIQYRARIGGSICLALLMGLIIWCFDMVAQPATLGSPLTALLAFSGYVLVMCLLLMGMLVCAVIDLRETLKNYLQAQRELLRGHQHTNENKPK